MEYWRYFGSKSGFHIGGGAGRFQPKHGVSRSGGQRAVIVSATATRSCLLLRRRWKTAISKHQGRWDPYKARAVHFRYSICGHNKTMVPIALTLSGFLSFYFLTIIN